MADVAPYSHEYNTYRQKIGRQAQGNTELEIEYEKILTRVKKTRESVIRLTDQHYTEPVDEIAGTVESASAGGITLTDLDCARAICAIQLSGILTREIAFHLDCSESLLRPLLTALQAPPEDRHLTHRGKISTNELARRARAGGTRRTAKHREAREFERTQAALQGCKFRFTVHSSRRVEAGFTAGQVSSDGGALLLREVDRRINLLGCLGSCFSDGRMPLLVKHQLPQIAVRFGRGAWLCGEIQR